MSVGWKPMHEVLPEGQVGEAKIEHFTVSEEDSRFTAFRPREYVAPGRYARLIIGGCLYMSDTQMEKNTNITAVLEARGDVLIAGLGMGMILVPILAKPEVKSVLVVEKSKDVIGLIAPHLKHPKLKVTHDDIFEMVLPSDPGFKETWDTIYFDIWEGICTDNLKEVTKLKRKFTRRKRPDGWMGAWMEETLRSQKRREDQEERHYRSFYR